MTPVSTAAAPELRSICTLLQVYDMPRSLAFYRDTLGFRVHESAPAADQAAQDDFGWVWLHRDGLDLMLNTAHDPDDVRPPEDPRRVAWHEDTGLYLACPDVDGAYEYLRARGVVAEPPAVAPYGMKQLYLKDPDGFNVCLQWPVSRPAREAAS